MCFEWTSHYFKSVCENFNSRLRISNKLFTVNELRSSYLHHHESVSLPFLRSLSIFFFPIVTLPSPPLCVFTSPVSPHSPLLDPCPRPLSLTQRRVYPSFSFFSSPLTLSLDQDSLDTKTWWSDHSLYLCHDT